MKTIAEMDAMISELEDLEVRYSALKKECNASGEIVDAKRLAILDELKKQGMTAFKGTKGTVSITHRYNVKFPQEPASREAFKKYLLANNAFESMWTVNHQRLNAWYKEEIESLTDSGEMPDVPGLAPVVDENLSFRRSAK